MNTYEQRQEARRERYEKRAEKADREAENRHRAARDSIRGIPPGQPILVGHHSEKRHRAALNRHDTNMRKGIEASQRAEHYRGKAAGVGTGGVSSDDPEAVRKLKENLEKRERRQDFMKRFNAAMRKRKKDDGAALRLLAKEFDLTPGTVKALLEPDVCGGIGFQPYQLSNNNAQIRRLKARIKKLQAQADDVTTREQIGAVEIVDDVEENRLQLFFPGKPSATFRRELKRSGFRWSRYNGCWQRHRSHGATYWGRQLAEQYNREEVATNGDS